MLGVLVRLLQRLRAAHHALCGRLAYRLGRTGAARRHFERVLGLGGDEFSAYVHLGRISLGEGDFAGYRREMSNARAIDPERFLHLRPTADGIEPRIVGTPFEETGERATWRSMRPGAHGIARRSPVRSAEVPTDAGEDAARTGPIYELPQPEPHDHRAAAAFRRAGRDDFSTEQERDRFRSLPPIRGSDLRAVDLDDLLRRFGA